MKNDVSKFAGDHVVKVTDTSAFALIRIPEMQFSEQGLSAQVHYECGAVHIMVRSTQFKLFFGTGYWAQFSISYIVLAPLSWLLRQEHRRSDAMYI